MVAYSFKARFITPILNGSKSGTIRAVGRRRHARPDNDLQLYVGMRTRQCRLVLTTRCIAASSIVMRWTAHPEIFVDGAGLEAAQFESFAHSDGFESFDAMAQFWRDVHPDLPVFTGEWIRWAPPPGPVEMGSDIRSLTRVAA